MRIKLLIGVVLTLLLGLVLLQLFGPNSGGTLGTQTTFITSPLAPDGLPNYAIALLDRQREGITPANNGAIQFWEAMGPRDMSVEHFALLCRKIGVNHAASSPYLVDIAGKQVHQSLEQWIRSERREANESGESPAVDDDLSAEEQIEQWLSSIQRTPWTAADFPPLAEWLAENEQPLDLIVAAAAKPKFFSPSPSVLANPNTPLIEITLPHAQAAREAARALAARATFRVGNRQYAQAWEDCRACWRLGAHIAEGPTLIEKLVGMAIRGVAKDSTLALLQADDLPEDIARQVFTDLEALTASLDMADSINHAERFMFLDFTLRLITGRLGGVAQGTGGYGGHFVENASRVLAFDVNVPLRLGNQWYDRLAMAATMDDRQQRSVSLERIEADISAVGGGINSKLLGGLLSRKKRSEAFGDVMLSLFLPAVGAAVDAKDRDQANFILVRLAAALAVHRSRTGEYPTSLDELVPAALADIPLDPYTKRPLIYERRGEGYLLYSVFENGVDDGGASIDGAIIDGEWLPPEDVSGAPECDLVIRLPMPPWEPLDAERTNDSAEAAQEDAAGR